MAKVFRYSPRKGEPPAKKWYGSWTEIRNGKKRTVKGPLSEDYQESLIMLGEILKRVKREQQNPDDILETRDDRLREHKLKLIHRHIEEHEQSMVDKNITPEQVRLVKLRILRLVEMSNIKRIGDITPSRIENALARLNKNDKLSIQTVNFYLSSIKRFTRWLLKNERIDFDPLTAMDAYGNVETDRKRVRRVLSPEEINRLIVGTQELGKLHHSMSAQDRSILYLVAVNTGLRVSELYSLTQESFDLGDNPTVTVEAGHSKRRRTDVLPLHEGIVPSIRTWLSTKGAKEKVFPGFWQNHAGNMIKRDLEALGIPQTDDRGRIADFHSLRHTFITYLVRSKLDYKTIMLLARHSTVRLTIDRYSHADLEEQREALQSIPSIHAVSAKTINVTNL